MQYNVIFITQTGTTVINYELKRLFNLKPKILIMHNNYITYDSYIDTHLKKMSGLKRNLERFKQTLLDFGDCNMHLHIEEESCYL